MVEEAAANAQGKCLKDGNAFFVTRVGQIRNVHNLIQQKDLKNNFLVIMFSVRNSSLLLNMQNAYRKDLFQEVLYLKLPKSPLRLSEKKGKAMYTGMENTLERLYHEFAVRSIYVCNIDNYYVYLERIIRQQEYAVQINLLEEGLTTYKITSGEPLDKHEGPVNKNDVRKAVHELKKSLKSLGRSLLRNTVNIAVLILQFISWIFHINLVKTALNIRASLLVKKQYHFGMIRNFDHAYVCFPEMVRSKELSFASVETLDFKFTEIQDPTVSQMIEGFSTLFINQKYVNYQSHFEIVFRIFRELGLKDVLIKLHPKEDITLVSDKIAEIKEDYPEIKVKVLGAIGQIPVEDLVYSYDITKVVGLTSSALIYLQANLHDVNIVSIANRYKQLCENGSSGVSSREMIQFNDEYRFFMKFKNLEQFEYKTLTEDKVGEI